MEFTGERFVPDVHGDIELEHLHRYISACEIVTGKIVLDIASGEGYGSFLLANYASKVIGVDISKEAIWNSREKYNKDNLEYMVGSCSDVPLADNSVDIVISFETIEHHNQHKQMMQEIKRVLRPLGILLISSPDKYNYSVEPNYINPYHVKELYRHEFETLVASYFKNITYFGQRVIYGSGMFSESLATNTRTYWKGNQTIKKQSGIVKPTYLIALASDFELPNLTTGFFEQPINESEIVQSWRIAVMERDNQITSLNQTVGEQHNQITSLNQAVDDFESSRSWRITRPMRVSVQNIRSAVRRIKRAAYYTSRSFYRNLPLSLEIKSSIKAKATPYIYRFIRPTGSSQATESNINTSKYCLFSGKDAARHHYQVALDSFLAVGEHIILKSSIKPRLSVVIVLYNQAELTLACLQSLTQHLPDESEVILIDNASTDKTDALLQLVEGATIIRNNENLHFLRACNQSRDFVKGQYLLLLNNDAQILSGTVEKAMTILAEKNEIGAVGGRIINLDGLLQEAGSIIWQDGSCLGYGRGEYPDKPEYRFRRPVDYCSGAFLLTRTALFQGMGGFDEAFAPAYYEETDYCVKLWEKGYQVVYDPDVVLYHFEFGSGGSAHANDLMVSHQTVFAQRHMAYLQHQQLPDTNNVLAARSHSPQPRILYVDDRVPRPRYGSGFPRACRIIHELSQQGLVTLYCTNHAYEDWQDIYADIPKEIEVMRGQDASGLRTFLQERTDYFDVIWVSRPHNMAHILRMRKAGLISTSTFIIYDAEALISFREQERARLQNNKPTIFLEEEMCLAAAADLVLAVSNAELEHFQSAGVAQCKVLGHCLQISPTPATYNERSDFLFVGALTSLDSPNADSLLWFSEAVWPLIREALGNSVQLNVVGYTPDPTSFNGRLAEGIQLIGSVPDLAPWYDLSRVAVVPTRFAAGIPFKAHDAAAHGVPLITTELIGGQLGWQNEQELLQTPMDEKLFAAACVRLYRQESLWNLLRQNALKAVASDTDSDRFCSIITESLRLAQTTINVNLNQSQT